MIQEVKLVSSAFVELFRIHLRRLWYLLHTNGIQYSTRRLCCSLIRWKGSIPYYGKPQTRTKGKFARTKPKLK